MASQAAIDAVKIQLPEIPEAYGISDSVIGSQLDQSNQTKSILFCLRAIAAKVAPIEDVSEAGSTRTMQFHARLMAMIADWQARSDAEDAKIGNLPPKLNAKTYTMVRV